MRDVHGGNFPVPNTFYATAQVEQGRIGLVEGAGTEIIRQATPPTNGLVAVVEGGLVVFTTREQGDVHFRVLVLAEPPDDATLGAYEDVVEVSYRAARGSADVLTLSTDSPVAARAVTFPGPGPVRARVQASGRDRSVSEQYILQLWQAPEAPEQVLRTAANVAAARATGPERAYRWIEESALEEAACLTFVPAGTTKEVLDAFYADPDDSAPWSDRFEAFPDLDPFVAVLDVPGGVVAVEDNRWMGVQPSVLRAVSREGRAAAAFWNVNGHHTLSFARHGTVLSSAEWGLEAVDPDLDPAVADAVAGIDYDDVHAWTAKDVLAVTRFTGLTLSPSDLDALETSRAYRVIPPLPALHPVARPPRGGDLWHGERFVGFYLSELAEEFSVYPTRVLTDLAHWAATQALAAVRLGEHPAIVATLQQLTDEPGTPLDADAALLVRRSALHHPELDHSSQEWQTRRYALTALHQATNPDPLGAVAGALGFAHVTLRTSNPDFLDQARQRAASL